MAERPILMSGPMVLAILDGRKTQTRRVIAFPRRGAFVVQEVDDGSLWPFESDDGETSNCEDGSEHVMSCPYGFPGDTLWVRETWRPIGERSLAECVGPQDVHFQASATEEGERESFHWRPSIHLPRWASRLTLRVTEVRVQRVQEISADDAKAEGVSCDECAPGSLPLLWYQAHFAKLWDSINGKRAPWSSNPWVWVVTFERVDGPGA